MPRAEGGHCRSFEGVAEGHGPTEGGVGAEGGIGGGFEFEGVCEGCMLWVSGVKVDRVFETATCKEREEGRG